MTNDDDVLGIDLDAWQPPPPPNVADGVIARMRRENTTVSAQALPVEAPPRAFGRRWWIAGGVTVAIAASTVITFALTRGPANARGVSAGDRAAHIAIGPSSADVDAHTLLSWRREGDRITAKQAGGAAAWRVDDDDTLTIETGLASIEATNASLRVEVKMLDEKKTIALSALTAAAVAAVTIVVYEGAVKAGGTTVPPGTAYQITAKGENVIEDEITVGAAPDRDLVARIAALEAELAEAKAVGEAARRPPPADFDKDMIHPTMRSLRSAIKDCGKSYVGTLELTVHVNADGSVMTVEASPDVPPRACVAAIVREATFPSTEDGGTFTYPIVFAAPVRTKCDADTPVDQGQAMFSSNRWAEALERFDQAYRCRPSAQIAKFAFASACKSKNVIKARSFWNTMSVPERDQMLSFCLSNGITYEELDEPRLLGRLLVTNAEPARVLVDGVAVGTTPVSVEVGPGKHKVTLVVGADKHTFSVSVKTGETVRLSKEVRQLE